MAIRHGNRLYCQLLLDRNRAALLQQQADEQGVKLTALLRDLLYKSLERSLPSSVYNDALAKDEAAWRASILNRVEGRKQKRAEKLKAAEDA